MQRDHSKDMSVQHINANHVEVVVLMRHVCFYVSSQTWVAGFWSNESTL